MIVDLISFHAVSQNIMELAGCTKFIDRCVGEDETDEASCVNEDTVSDKKSINQ
jgi:hypothetical protein